MKDWDKEVRRILHDFGTTYNVLFIDERPADLEKALKALRKATLAAVPEKRMKRNGGQTKNIATAEWGWNQCRKEVLDALGVKE